MFIFDVNYMLKELKENFKQGYELISNLPSIESKEYIKALGKQYPKCESISIDYAVMEKSNDIYVIPSDFGWDDVGTWKSLERYIKPDDDSNLFVGNIEPHNASNNVIYGGNKKIVLLDINDIFCIDSDDIIVIGKKEKMSEIHKYRNKM